MKKIMAIDYKESQKEKKHIHRYVWRYVKVMGGMPTGFYTDICRCERIRRRT